MQITIETNPEHDDVDFTHDKAHEITAGIAKHLRDKGHDINSITLNHGGLKGGTHTFNLAAPNGTTTDPIPAISDGASVA